MFMVKENIIVNDIEIICNKKEYKIFFYDYKYFWYVKVLLNIVLYCYLYLM